MSGTECGQTAAPESRDTYNFTDSRGISRLVSDKGDPNEIIAAEIGPGYWDYRRRWDEARAYEATPPFPLQVDFEQYYGCNLRCPICIMSLPGEERAKFGDPSKKLGLGVIKRLLDEGAANGQAAVGLNGICEPLLSPDLPEIVEYARSVGMADVMFNTNGLALDETVSRRLIEAGLTRIMISLDAATPETYRKIRVGSDFEKVTANVRRFAEIRSTMGKKLPILRVSFCVTSLNEAELPDFMEQWAPIVDFFSIQHYGNTFEGNHALERSRLFPDSHRYQPDAQTRCAQPNKRVMVRHNGDVVPCCDASGLNLVIGNVHHNTLSEIWNGKRAVEIRQKHENRRYQDEPICVACTAKWGPPPVSEGTNGGSVS